MIDRVKKVVVTVICVISTSFNCYNVKADEVITVFAGSDKYNGYLHNDRTYIPIEILEKLDYKYYYDVKTELGENGDMGATFHKNGGKCVIYVNVFNSERQVKVRIVDGPIDTTITYNNIDTLKIADSYYIPIGVLRDVLKLRVLWNPIKRDVTVIGELDPDLENPTEKTVYGYDDKTNDTGEMIINLMVNPLEGTQEEVQGLLVYASNKIKERFENKYTLNKTVNYLINTIEARNKLNENTEIPENIALNELLEVCKQGDSESLAESITNIIKKELMNKTGYLLSTKDDVSDNIINNDTIIVAKKLKR